MNDVGSPQVTLIFPAVNQLAFDYWQTARLHGATIVTAASVACDEFAFNDSSARLPMIYEASFGSAFIALLAKHSIARIYCPVASVYAYLRRFLAEQGLPIELLGNSPIHRQMTQHQELMTRSRKLWPLIVAVGNGSDLLPLLDVAGLLRQTALIYGESSDEKLAAMIAIAANAPNGDVVEIGSLMGRTAFALLYLARRYRIGRLLTVDPWLAANAVHHDSPEVFDSLVDEWDYEALSQAFFVNLAPFFGNDHTHLRMPSEQALAVYERGDPILTRDSLEVPFCRKIAILHVDGNHDYAAVRQDCDLWLGHLLPGAWLILDDYQWAHGDGPRRVGDELLEKYSGRIERAFVCGKAMFIKLSTDIDKDA
ncbi:MAG: class I SAM-dependent methyltransferase [Candidatus Accumulibacter sp. UW26]|jgi:hypothetical protein